MHFMYLYLYAAVLRYLCYFYYYFFFYVRLRAALIRSRRKYKQKCERSVLGVETETRIEIAKRAGPAKSVKRQRKDSEHKTILH